MSSGAPDRPAGNSETIVPSTQRPPAAAGK